MILERIEIERGREGGKEEEEDEEEGERAGEREREQAERTMDGPQLRCAQLRGWPRCHALT